jgi:hypothetical protein
MKGSYLGFLIFVSMMIVFFILPDPKGLQKPFRVLLGISFVVIYFALLIKKEIDSKTLWPVIIGGLLVLIMILKGNFQTNLINAYLCLFGLLSIPKLLFGLSRIRKTNLDYILLIGIVSILLQLVFYRSPDGRPTLSYQINFAGAYLFLFFLCSDILKNKYGKLFVIAIALVLAVRLLIYSIALFYLVRYFKKYLSALFHFPNAAILTVASYIVLTLFSLWYVNNVKSDFAYNKNISRVVTINDDSNQMRFLANAVIIGIIYASPLSDKVLFGLGSIENFTNETNNAVVMPHNEIFDALVEYGIIAVIFFSIFSLTIFNRVTTYSNLEYFIPILFHTLILYVRFLIIPSFEMLFIVFILYLAGEENGDRQLVLNKQSLKQSLATHNFI